MTGETFTGRQAAEMGLVNRAVPLANLREETVVLARKLLRKTRSCYAQQSMDSSAARTHLGAE